MVGTTVESGQGPGRFASRPRLRNSHPLFTAGRAFAALIAGALSGCGGGGGGSAEPAAAVPAATAAQALPVAPSGNGPAVVATTAVISGKLSFASVPNASGALQYGLAVDKPARGITVQALDPSDRVVATGVSDSNGNYQLTVPQPSLVAIQVLAEMKRSGSGAAWNVAVRDNTQGNGLYALKTLPLAVTASGVRRDIVASSGWSAGSYSGTRYAAPFALLDTVYTAQQKVLSAAPSAVFPALSVYWSVNNLPSSGNLALGQIGTSFFSGWGTDPAIYVLGKANVDTDEYDASVIAHEWGHYYQSAFSRDDSFGGSHASGDKLDRRIAFAEGWGNAWSGMALARSNYTDSYGPAQASGFAQDLTVGAPGDKGWFSEASIQYVLWKLHAAAGFQAIHNAMAGPLRTSAAVTSIHAFHAALKTVSASAGNLLAPLLAAENIASAADPWGSTETNDGGLALTVPMYRALIIGTPLSGACVSNAFGQDPGDNKHGNYTYLRFTVAASGNYQINVSGPAGTDPDFAVFNTGGYLAGAATSTPGSEIKSIALQAGEHVLAITDYNNQSASTCFTASVV